MRSIGRWWRWREWWDVNGSHTAHIENFNVVSHEVDDGERAQRHALVLNLNSATPWLKRVNLLLDHDVHAGRRINTDHDPVDLVSRGQRPWDGEGVRIPAGVTSHGSHDSPSDGKRLLCPHGVKVEDLNGR